MANHLKQKRVRKSVYSVYLNDAIDEIVEEIARKEKRTSSNLICNLIEKFLEDNADNQQN